jgi:acetyl-CoA carboxylase biotin carboxylase subunit
MGSTAVRVGKLAGYANAGTVEFMVDQNRNFYFLEMNTRLQVEHPVTEWVTGIDLVKEQIRIAAGERLAWKQDDVRMRGWAMECRIYAEDPAQNFFPSPGLITRLRVPSGPGVRDDGGVNEGFRVPIEYDPLLSKLAVWGSTREEAMARMRRALSEYEVSGIQTNIPFFRRLLDHPDLVAGRMDTGFIDRALEGGLLSAKPLDDPEMERAAILGVVLETLRKNNPRTVRVAPSSGWKMAGRESLLNHWPTRGR